MMKINKLTLTLITSAALAASAQEDTARKEADKAAAIPANDSGPRKLHLLQDDAQQVMVSRVYELKNASAADLTPFILTAVKRYNINSAVERLNFAAAGKQLLMVSAPPDMQKYVSDLVTTLDRPGIKKDVYGSIVTGTGIYRFAYQPRFRSSDDMVTIINNAIRWKGYAWRDPVSNLIYWKESDSAGKYIKMWVKVLDHPVPQAELNFKIYEIRQSELRDIGVDYLAWKNGPGQNIFAAGWEAFGLSSTEKSLADIDMFSSWAYGGFFVAPKFDLSFVRLLSQRGRAQIAGTAMLTVVNNYAGAYFVHFSPEYQNITKDENDKSSVTVGATVPLDVSLSAPVICFRKTGEVDAMYKSQGFEYSTFANIGGSIQFNYSISSSFVVERSNRGVELTDRGTLSSSLTADLGQERLLAVYSRKQQVEQTVGVPFLVDIPVLKYLFGTETKLDEDTKYFVTVTGRIIHPKDSFAEWSGRLVSVDEFERLSKFSKE